VFEYSFTDDQVCGASLRLQVNQQDAPRESTLAGPFTFEQRSHGRRRDAWWVVVALALAAVLTLLHPTAAAQVKEVRRVLIFYGLGLSSPAAVLVDREIRSALQNSSFQIELYTESLEPILFSDPASQEELRQGYISKYRDRRPDVVIAVGPSPLKFMVDSHEKFLPNVPIIFCSSTEDQLDNQKLDAHFTGAWRTLEPARTLDAALQLQPRTRHVVVVGGVNPYDRRLEATVRQRLQSYASRLDFKYLTDAEMPALLEQLKRLPGNTIILYTALSQDSAGTRFIDETQSLPMVVGAANAPVFVMEDTMVGQGTVGGVVTAYAAEGHVAGATAVRVLNGERVQDIPIVRDTNIPMFDARALQRWGSSESALPPASTVLYQQPPLWRAYKRYIIGAVFLCLAETLLIVGLLWQRARRRKVEESLSERLTFESLLSDLSTTFINLSEQQVDANIEKSLSRILDFLRLDRITLFEFSTVGSGMIVAASWTTGGIQPPLLNLKVGQWPWWSHRAQLGETVLCADPHQLPEEAHSERQYLLESGIQSIASVPLEVAGRIIGAITFVANKRRVDWDEELVKQLKVLAEIFSNALERKRTTQALVVSISELKRSESVLRESEERLRLAMESSNCVGWEWDLKTGQDKWFGDLETMFGIQSDSRVGRPEDFHRFLHPDDRQQVAEAVANAQENQEPYAAEFRVVWPDGTLRWVAATGKFYYAPDGAPERMLGMALDITERKLAEQALRQSEAELTEAQRLADMGSWQWDPKTDKVIWSEGLYRITGVEPSLPAVSYKDHPKLYTPESWQRLRSAVEEALRTGTSYELDLEMVRPDGSTRWLIARGEVQHDATGGVERLRGTVHDITERKRAEHAIRESEERFRLVANTAPVMIWMSGTDKQCTYFNTTWLSFTGRSMASEVGNGWAEGVHPEDFNSCMETYNRAFDLRNEFSMEYRLRRYDGEYRWLLDVGVPRFNPDRSFAGYIGSCLDVTERKLAEDALSGISRKLIEAQEQERSRIARELHDDINQRLALVAIGLDQIEELQLSPSQPIAEVSIRLRELAERVSEIGTEVQAISHRLHSSKLEYLGIVSAAKSFCREFGEQQKIDISFCHDDIPRSVPQETSLCLFRVLQEALQNAVKHSGVRHFDVALRAVPDSIQLTVSDSGVGFDLEEGMKASGLGLISMVERMKLVNGQLSIDSRRDSGTTINARVPLSKVARAAG
jgi:PAS domain S-box-containing protein